jgi:hypothetical protein
MAIQGDAGLEKIVLRISPPLYRKGSLPRIYFFW